MVRLRECRRGVARSVAWRAMDDPLQLGRDVEIPLAEVELRTSRSSGPGGQHANVTASRVEAVFDVEASRSLTEEQKRRMTAGSVRWSGRPPRTPAARRATASWRCSACARGSPGRSSVQRPRRPDQADGGRAPQAPGLRSAAAASASGRGGGRTRSSATLRSRPSRPLAHGARARSARPRRRPRRPAGGVGRRLAGAAAGALARGGRGDRPAAGRRAGSTGVVGGRVRVGRLGVGLVGVGAVAEVVRRGRHAQVGGRSAWARCPLRRSRSRRSGPAAGRRPLPRPPCGGACRRSPARADQAGAAARPAAALEARDGVWAGRPERSR